MTGEPLPGVHPRPDGQVALSGDALSLFEALDGLIVRWARDWEAEDWRFPPFLAAGQLAKLDYFASFPHLVTLPVTLEAEEANLAAFAAAPLDPDGSLRLTRTASVREVLTPAACYHVYGQLEGRSFNAPRYVTTRCACFRKEARYEPLRRQWGFTMREVVCLGTAAEVQALLEDFRERIGSLAHEMGLEGTWAHATDPFFNPSRNPKFLMQTIAAIKQEFLVDDGLALCSTNSHGTYFGEAFGILREGQPVFSGCVAFGLERWLHALGTTCGLPSALRAIRERAESLARIVADR